MAEAVLPTRLCFGNVVPFGDTFLIVGGDTQMGNERYTEEILQFDPDSESWIVRDERMTIGRYLHFTVWVDASDYNCY